ncbi:MAG: hypothetical protein ABW185_06735 [Sedimenticola sp.]
MASQCDLDDPDLTALKSVVRSETNDDSVFQCGQVLSDTLLLKDGHQYSADNSGFTSPLGGIPDSYKTERELSTYRLDDTVFDRLNLELQGMPRALYIQNLIQLCNGCDETVMRFRMEMALTAKHCESGPTGNLITRKRTKAGTVIEKYAADCFALYEYINGNRNDVDELFKPATRRDTLVAIDNPCDNAALWAEINSMKATIVTLSTDVNTLKALMRESSSSLKELNATMTQEIHSINGELLKCKNSVDEKMNTPGKQKSSSNSLSQSLCNLSVLVKQLETHKTSFVAKLCDIETHLRDNTNCIEHLNDDTVSGNNNVKTQVKDVRQMMLDVETSIKKNNSVAVDNEKALTEMKSTVKTVAKAASHAESLSYINEKQVSEVSHSIKKIEQNVNAIGLSNIEMCFKSFSNDISVKLDKVCETVVQVANGRSAESHDDIQPSRAIMESPMQSPQYIAQNLFQNTSTNRFFRPRDLDTTSNYKAKLLNDPENPTDVLRNSNILTTDTSRSVVDTLSGQQIPVVCAGTIGEPDYSGAKYRQDLGKSGLTGFRGVQRKKIAKFFVGGIDPDCNESDLKEHLKQNDVKCVRATVFNSRLDDSLCAQISIWEEHAGLLSDPNFWPPGTTCRKWFVRTTNVSDGRNNTTNPYGDEH